MPVEPRVDYDQIAEQYDAQPFRNKPVDPDLLTFLSERVGHSFGAWALLDIGCGTGNQLVANGTVMPAARMERVGFERVTVTLDHQTQMRAWPDVVQAMRWRERCSQLIALTDDEYQAGMRRVLASWQVAKRGQLVRDAFCLLKVRGDKSVT